MNIDHHQTTREPANQLAGSFREQPLRTAYSLAEISAKLTEWMVAEYGHPRTLKGSERNRWHEREGMIHHFLICTFPDENGKTFHQPE